MCVGDNLLAVEVYVCLGVRLVELLFGAREHAAGAAGEIADFDDLAGLLEVVAAFRQCQAREQVHHFARGVVVAGLGVFGEAADDLFEHVAHGDVVHARRVEIELGKLAHDPRELGALVHFGYFFVEFQVGEYLLDVGREGVDVRWQILVQLRRVTEEFAERPAAGVVERVAGFAPQHGIGDAGVCLVGLADSVFGRRQGAFNATKDDHGDDNVAVLVGLIGAAKGVSDAEDGVYLLLYV